MAKVRENSRAVPTTATTLAALPAPRFAFGWAALVYALCTLSLAYPALAGRFLVNPRSDQYIAGYAFREFAASTLKATGHFPLWNPYLFGGMPYIAAMHGDIFYPTFLLRMVLPTDVAMTWGFIIHVFLCGLFTYGFLRGIGYGFYGSLIGGIAYMMSGQIASYVSPGHDGKLFVSALFPLALWLLYGGFKEGKTWVWGAFALVIGLCVLSPHPQLLQYTLLTCGAYSLFLAFASVDGARLERSVALRGLAASLVAVIIGLAIGAVQYLPVREYVAWSPRAGGLADYQSATSYAWPPEELFNAYLPQFSGMLGNYWGRNGIHLHSDYVGAIVLVIAGAAFIGYRTDAHRKQMTFWLVALIISVLWSLGSATPFYHIPYAIVPGTKYFRAPATIFFVGTFAIALFAAAGTERFLQGRVTRKYLYGWLIAAGIIAVLASVGALTSVAETFADDRRVDMVQANRTALMAGAWRSLVFVALVAGLGFAFLSRKISPRGAAWLLAALMALDLWTIERIYWMFSPRASVIYAADPIVNALKAEPQPVRVLAVPLQDTPQHDAFLSGDALMTYRIRNTFGYHGNQLGRYNELIGFNSDLRRALSPNVLQLTNTKYILTNIPELPLPNVVPDKGPVLNAAGDSVYLYRVGSENPYAWVTPVAVKAPDDQVLATVLNPRFDVRRAALFDTSAKVRASTGVEALPAPLSITTNVRHYEPGKVTIDLSAPAPPSASLVVSENYYPGWTATVDGKPASIGRVDYTLIGVDLPAGARTIELAFTSRAYETGKIITWLAIGVGLLLMGAGAWTDRRRIG
jgi:membrane protein YfhO